MSKSNSLETSILALLYNATAITALAVNHTSSPATNIYVALHTADPGEAGTQSTSEISYTGYARVAVARTSGGWTISGNQATNAVAVTWGACTAGSGTATYWSTGLGSSGATAIMHSGIINNPSGGLIINPGITPQADIGDLVITEE